MRRHLLEIGLLVAVIGCSEYQRGPRFEIKETDTTLQIYATEGERLVGSLELAVVEPGHPHQPGVSEWEGPFGDRGRVLKVEADGLTMTHESEGMMPIEIPLTPEDRGLGDKALHINAFVQSPEVSAALARWHVTFSTLPVLEPAPETGETSYYGCGFDPGSNCTGSSQSGPNCCQSGYGYWTNSNGEERCCPGQQLWARRACNTACGTGPACPNLPEASASNCFACSAGCCRDHYTYGRQGPNGCVTAATYSLAGPNYLCNIRDNPNPYYCMITTCSQEGSACSSSADCCYGGCWDNGWSGLTCGGI